MKTSLFLTLLALVALPASLLANRAISFTTSSVVHVPNFHKLGVTDEVTLEFWAFTNGLGGHTPFQLIPDQEANRFSCHISYGTGDSCFWDRGDILANPLARQNFQAPFPTPSRWVHWAMVSSKAGNFTRTYMNGELVIQRTGQAPLSLTANGSAGYTLVLGKDMDGKMADFRIWNVARTPTAIRADMYRSLAGSEPGLRLYYTFDNMALANKAKATGVAFNGTLQGATFITSPLQPSSHIVTNTNDEGPGSLRAALASAVAVNNANPAPQRITFSPLLNGKTIHLGSAFTLSTFGDGITLDASTLPLGITLAAAPASGSRVFNVNSTSQLSLQRMVLTGARDSAIYCSTGSVTLTDCHLRDNLTTTSGGAIRAESGSRVELSRCTFSGNSAIQFGGALYVGISSSALITRCTLSGNSAQDGGAIELGGSSQCTLRHSTVANNRASRDGGAIDHYTSNSTLNLLNCILSGNADEVGYQDLFITANTSTNLTGANAFGVDTQGGGTATGAIPIIGQINLQPLAANGGFTPSHELRAAHPVANNNFTGSRQIDLTDQRGQQVLRSQDLGAYEIQPGSFVSFVEPATNLNEGSSTNVSLERYGDPGPAFTVTVATVPGTATAADFTPISTTLSFAANEMSKSVPVSTLTDSDNELNESFSLKLSAPSAGAKLGAVSSCSVIIQDPSSSSQLTDAQSPTLLVSSPAHQSTIQAAIPSFITLTGTAKDNKSVAEVSIYHNGGIVSYIAKLSTPFAPTTAWTAQVPVASGPNIYLVYTTDGANNTSSSTQHRLHVQTPLKVTLSGNGSVTSGFAPQSFWDVGKPYTLTATPRPGAMFSGWTILTHTAAAISASDLSHPTLSFIHREGLVLRASFLPSPFIGATASFYVGTFNGQLRPNTTLPNRDPVASVGAEDGTAASVSTQGFCSFTTQSDGSFTGKIFLDGTSYPVAGIFAADMFSRFGPSRTTSLTIARTGKPALTVTIAHLGTLLLASVSQADVNGLVARSDALAYKNSYTTTAPLTGSIVGPYTAQISLPSFVSATSLPGGRGFFTMNLSSVGTATLAGKLPEGTAFTASTTLSNSTFAPIFVSLYGGKGLFTEMLNFNLAPVESDFTSLNGLWIRPVQDSQHYPAGWPTGTVPSTLGNRHIIPTTGVSAVPGLPAIDADGNANLQFTSGNLSVTLISPLSIPSTDIVRLPVAHPTSPTLVINRSTGGLTGSFIHTDGTRVKFEGVLFGAGTERGMGFFLSTLPRTLDYLGQGGGITLLSQ